MARLRSWRTSCPHADARLSLQLRAAGSDPRRGRPDSAGFPLRVVGSWDVALTPFLQLGIHRDQSFAVANVAPLKWENFPAPHSVTKRTKTKQPNRIDIGIQVLNEASSRCHPTRPRERLRHGHFVISSTNPGYVAGTCSSSQSFLPLPNCVDQSDLLDERIGVLRRVTVLRTTIVSKHRMAVKTLLVFRFEPGTVRLGGRRW